MKRSLPSPASGALTICAAGAGIGAFVGFVGVFVVAFLELVSEGLFDWPTWNDSLSNRFQDAIFSPSGISPWDATMLIGSPAVVCAAIGSVLRFLYWSKHRRQD